MHCTIAKEIWDRLNSIYEGDTKVEQMKMQNFRTRFETNEDASRCSFRESEDGNKREQYKKYLF